MNDKIFTPFNDRQAKFLINLLRDNVDFSDIDDANMANSIIAIIKGEVFIPQDDDEEYDD